MNEVNFLPGAYLQQQSRQSRSYRCFLLLGVLVVGLCGWYLLNRTQVALLAGHVRTVEGQAAVFAQQGAGLERLRIEQHQLWQQLRAARHLSRPVTPTQVLAVLAGHMPPAVALQEVTLAGTRPAPGTAGDGAGSPPTAGSVAADATRDLLRLRIVGLAPGDGEVADLVGRLTDEPLFIHVKLGYSRAVDVGQLLAREFVVELEVPMERSYKIVPSGSSVAAGPPGARVFAPASSSLGTGVGGDTRAPGSGEVADAR